MKEMIWDVARHAVASPLLAVLCFAALMQGMLNSYYGYNEWGGGGFSGVALIMGGVYLAVEAIKVTTAHEAGRRFHNGSKWSACGLFVIAMLCLVFSLQAHVGFLGSHRNDNMAQREARVDTRDVVRDELRRLRAERETIGTVQPIATIEARKAAECASGDGPRCKEWRAKLGLAERARAVEARIASLMSERRETAVVGVGDPQTAVLGWISRAGEDDKKLALAVAAAVIIELAVTFGFMFAGERSREPETLAGMLEAGIISHPGAQTVVDFKASVLEPVRGASLAEDDVCAAFETWCAQRGEGGMDRSAFLRLLEATPARRRDGRFYGLALKPAFLLQRVI
jgi:hypothetical protein